MPNGSACCSIARSSIDSDKRLAARLRYAKLRHQAAPKMSITAAPAASTARCSESSSRASGSTRTTISSISGPTGVGKSWLACALGHKACRDNRSVLYSARPGCSTISRWRAATAACPPASRASARVELLILDDWGLEPLDADARHDLLEILEERYGRRSTIVTSQLPVDKWHEVIGDPTYADAILDRLVHNAHRIDLTGDSLRRAKTKPRLDRHPKNHPHHASTKRPQGWRDHIGITGGMISE